jgi:hypothetical protein
MTTMTHARATEEAVVDQFKRTVAALAEHAVQIARTKANWSADTAPGAKSVEDQAQDLLLTALPLLLSELREAGIVP